MWTKLIDIVQTRWNENQMQKQNLANAINTLYGIPRLAWVRIAYPCIMAPSDCNSAP